MTHHRLKYRVALRKESVDRNLKDTAKLRKPTVALRKESVDRNSRGMNIILSITASLSARRAWIEMDFSGTAWVQEFVALRKESVDRNPAGLFDLPG